MQNDIRDRIRQAVNVDPRGCWIWQRSANKVTGYGRTSVNGRNIGAHVASYTAFVGPIPAGKEIDHLCRVRLCVNPAHLEAVDHRTNCLRAPRSLASLNVAKTACPAGHAYDEANTYVHRSGKRDCRTCRREAGRRSYARRKAVSA